MDPLSITAGIIAVLGAGGKVAGGLSKIRGLRRAPDALLQLNNEVTDLQLLVQAIDELYRQNNETTAIQQEVVCSTLERAKHTVLELEKLIAYTLTKETGVGTEVDRVNWFRYHDRVKEMRDSLRCVRSDLNAVWMVMINRTGSSRIELRLRQVYVATEELRLNQIEYRNLSAGIGQEVANQGHLLKTVKHELLQRLEEGSSSQALQPPEQPADSPIFQSYNELGCTPGADTRIFQSVFQLKLTKHQGCQAFCICSCHRQRLFRSPSILDCIFGSLFVGYIGFPGHSQICNIHACHKNTEKTASLRYIFPGWLLKRTLVTTLVFSKAKGPEMLLRYSRVRPQNCQFFDSMFQTHEDVSHLDLVKGLLKGGEGSVLDVDEGGRSALHMALADFNKTSSAIVRLLLDEGADPIQADHDSMTPYQIAWQSHLGQRIHPPSHWEWFQAFDKRDQLETLGFQSLHTAVLGLNLINMSFESQLALVPRNEIDQRDSIGRTALSWASQRGDIEIVERLLMKGANPNAPDFKGKTPLLRCTNDVKCLEALLEAGAFVDSVDFKGTPTLSMIIFGVDDTLSLEILWRYKANLNRQGSYKFTALHYAANFDRVNTAEWLIQKGACLEVCTIFGQTPLLRAIDGRSYGSLKVLLDNGADYRIKDMNREGLLHTVARYGDLRIVSILRQAGLSCLDIDEIGLCGLNIYEKSPHGKTAMDLAEWRRDHNSEWFMVCSAPPDADPGEWFKAFVDLVDSIRATDVADRFGDFWTSLDLNDNHNDPLDDTARSTNGERARKRLDVIPGQGVGRTLPGSYPSQDGEEA